MKRGLVEFTVEYFKPSGKFYSSDKFITEVQLITTESEDIAYMQDVVDYLKGLRARRLPVPGLSGSGLDFFIRVDCEIGHPCLILPETRSE